jgi:maltose alpha-D-glucosyltransferase/alpha-amylase
MRRRAPLFSRPRGLIDEPQWYKDAIIYELRVKSFMDSNSDGIGDFQGLTSRLDYLSDLGVTALWLLPFYPSPNRDDGYDISDYTDVHSEVGTLDDFKEFLDEAHRRGLRVITELVINHTSEAHPWFQRARRAAKGTTERDFYVWNDTPEKYKHARIIFQDFEPSNWSWDPLAKQYYWHRFFAHQPDLNFDNPAVHDAVLSVVDFWLGMGVDGLRLDAVPYLYERDGTNCENLRETHEYLRKLRQHVDEKFKNRMLLAEANQWPEDAAAYFGDPAHGAPECHMNFHFPIMPRIFMSIHMEDRLPVIDILAQTPQLHESCQWAMFLRNHDELTLEMVTDEERDYMVRAYAMEPAMRINLGIRRRLAPLLGNDRREIELMNALLFSLPGTPVVYYGDEIGMGDNVYLGDRNGVRTPMQWSADRNAGFSRCNPQRLILPVIIDPEYHYESLNVEAQQANANSLLWWMKRLVALRKRYQAFGRGSIEFLHPDNPRVLAFVRRWQDETILVVANLSRNVQYVEIDLHEMKGLTPIELFGGTAFPSVGDLPYLLTLGGHAFYWFALERAASAEGESREAAYQPPVLSVRGAWTSLLDAGARPELEETLAEYLEGRRWFRPRGRSITAAHVVEQLAIAENYRLLFLQVDFSSGDPETYVIPAAFTEDASGELRARSPQAILATLTGDVHGLLYDPLADVPSALPMLNAIARTARMRGSGGELVGTPMQPMDTVGLEPRSIKPDHPNAIVIYGQKYLLKFFRLLDEGVRPSLELGRALARSGQPVPVPPLVGCLEYKPRRGEPITLATVHQYAPAESDGRAHVREEVRRYFERVLAAHHELPSGLPAGTPLQLAEGDPPAQVRDLFGAWLDQARLLGERAAEVQLVLTAPSDAEFTPEEYSVLDQRSTYQAMRNTTGSSLRHLKLTIPRLHGPVAEMATSLIERAADVYKRFEPLLSQRLTALRCRRHGDFHLGSVLYTGRDWMIIDFDGRHGRPLPERRRKRSPLRDLAGMLRSLEHAAFSVLLDPAAVRESDRESTRPWAWLWYTWTASAFLRGYLETAHGSVFLPRDRREVGVMLDAFLLERTLKDLDVALESDLTEVPVILEFLLRQI